MKTTLTLLMVLFTVQVSALFGQSNADSLWTVYRAGDSSEDAKLGALYALFAENKIAFHPDTFWTYGTAMEKLAREIGSINIQAMGVMNKGIAFTMKGQIEESDSCYQKALDMFSSDVPEIEKAKVWMNMGNSALSKGLLSESSDFHERALEVAKRENDKMLQSALLTNLANVKIQQGDIARAAEMFTTSLQLNEQVGDIASMGNNLSNIGMCYSMLGDMEKGRRYYRSAAQAFRLSGQAQNLPRALLNMAATFMGTNEDSAFYFLEQAIDATILTGDIEVRSHCYGFKAMMYQNQGLLDSTIYYQQKGLALAEQGGDIRFVMGIRLDIARTLLNQGKIKEALAMARGVEEMAISSENVQMQANTARLLWGVYQESGDYKSALQAYERFVAASDSLESEQNQRETIKQEYRYSYEKQALADSLEFAQKEAIKDLEIEKRDANLAKQRIGLAAAGGGLLLLLMLAYSIRRGKKRSDELLHNILPEEIATELKQKGKVGSKRIEQVTVLFTDFKGFTAMAEKLSPQELVEDLNVCFSEFDRIVEKYGIEKIKTIGDAYMAAGGLPLPDAQQAEHVIKAALEMRDFVEQGKQLKIEQGLPYFEIRIGIHTGPVVAGIVGVKKFQYDIWGDTVNTASRMESSGEVGQVNISEATFELVKDNTEFGFTSRGKIEAKGKGEMEMYFVNHV